MIRRWSYLNIVNKNLLDIFFFEKKYQLLSLKSSVRYKRSAWRVSLVRRKVWGKRKHLGNWAMYFKIFSLWGLHYNKIRHYLSYQFFNQIFSFNFFFFNPNLYFKSNKRKLLSPEFFVLSNLSKRSYTYFFKRFDKLDNYFFLLKNLMAIKLFTNSKTLNFADEKSLTLHSSFENELYFFNETESKLMSIHSNYNFDPFTLYISLITEIYKISLVLFYYNLKNFK